MINLGLSKDQQRILQAALLDHNRVRTRVEVRNLDGDPLADLTDHLIDGQVDVDSTQQITRTASLVLTDERRNLPFDTDAPSTSALYLDRIIRIDYEVLVDYGDGLEWQGVPVFTGPIGGPNAMTRNGDQVTIACQGKEAIAMGNCWRPLTIKKGTKRTDAIRTIMGERAGETRMEIPDLPSRLPHHLSLHREQVLWVEARKIAHSLNRQLFYDGRGRLRLRTWPTGHTTYRFTGEKSVTSSLSITYSSDNVVNAVQVVGGVPRGSKVHVAREAVAPRDHPLSPWNLGPTDAPRYLAKVIRNDKIKIGAEALALAERELADGLLQQVQVQFDAFPVPLLDPGDLCEVGTDDGAVTFRLQQFSLPLVVGDPMSVGANRRRSLRRVRRHR